MFHAPPRPAAVTRPSGRPDAHRRHESAPLVDFQHTIAVRQLAATIDVHIHYSLEQQGAETVVSRWLVLDIKMPLVFRPLRPLVTASFDKENLRTMAALKRYAEKPASRSG